MRNDWRFILTIALVVLSTLAFAQQGGPYDLSWWTIDGGGTTFSYGGRYEVGGTIGQPDASDLRTAAPYAHTSGFWFPCIIAGFGDVDGDGCVDDADLLVVLFNFGATGVNPADVNCDSNVDDADLLIVLFNFGQCFGPYKLYIPDRDTQRGVVVYDPITNTTSDFGCPTTGTRFYYGIDIHPNGQIWACNHWTNRIDILSRTGNCVSTIAVPASSPRGIAIHPLGQIAVVAAENTFRPYDIANNAWGSPFFSGGSLCWGVAWDAQGQFLYAANGDSLLKFQWNGGFSFTQVASGAPSVGGYSADIVVLDNNVLAPFGRRIEEFDLNCNRIRTVATAPAVVHGIAKSPDGQIWVTTYEDGGLYRLDLTTGTLQLVTRPTGAKLGSGLVAK